MEVYLKPIISACMLLVPFDAVRRVVSTANVTLSIYHVALDADGWMFAVSITACVVCLMVTAYFAFDFMLCLFSSTRQMLYDRVTGITHVNTVKQKEKLLS